MDEETRPKVTRMVVFKHGVAYLERKGPAAGSFDLSFQAGEMNDVLKSLSAWVVEGDARITSFGFDAPGDVGTALPEGAALDALIASLRGRTVDVRDARGSTRGEVLGLQHRVGTFGERRSELLLRTGPGTIVVVDIHNVHTIFLVEDVARERLAHEVTQAQAATQGDTRFVHVTMEGSARDLRVAYVIPAPAWRVSYRLVRDGDEATLVAMGIVHNPVDEDLEGVELTLTTGQPISFEIDLYHPKEVERPVIEEKTRVSPPPTEHERTTIAAKRRAQPRAGGLEIASPRGGGVLSEEWTHDVILAAEGASEGVERGELFEYRVKTPVTIRRGGAAMVPLAAARVSAKAERIWRLGMGRTPDLVAAFTNDTGLVLEEGPAVLYDEGVYAGESMLPYSARGADVKMTFAKDLAVRVSSSTQTTTVVAGVRIVEGGLMEEKRVEQHHTIGADSDHDEAVELIVEMPKVTGHSLAEGSAKPFEETPSFRRFRVEVPAHGHAELSIREVRTISRRVAVESIEAHEVERWFRDRHLDDATYRALSRVLALRDELRSLEEQRKRVEAEQAAAYAKQSKISEQLDVLKETGPEGQLRLRYVKELAEEQDKVNAAETELRRLSQAIEETRQKAKEELRRLVTP